MLQQQTGADNSRCIRERGRVEAHVTNFTAFIDYWVVLSANLYGPDRSMSQFPSVCSILPRSDVILQMSRQYVLTQKKVAF